MSRRYGHGILVSGYPVLTAVSWPYCECPILKSYIKDVDLPRHAWDTPPFLLIVSPTPTVQSVYAYVCTHVYRLYTTRRKEVDHISWVWGSVPRVLRAHGSPAIKIPFFPLPMIYTVQKLVQQVKDTFPSFIYFPTALNIRVKPVMWRRNNIDSEPNLF